MNSVLITGGTGSLGRILAATLHAERICIFSRDEYKQAEMRREFSEDRFRWFIGDVRDRTRLRRALAGVDTVIHCAALKRVQTGTYDASELVKTNVLGTLNLIEAATDAGCNRVLAVSTDKACRPVSAYGASKLLMEKVILAANNARGDHGPLFGVVRLGNFAGSRGSVIPIWRSAKGAVEVSDINCTRFWISEAEAAQVVISAARDMVGGDTWMPRLRAFKLLDLLAAMNITNVIATGLGPEERLHEYMGEVSSESAARMSVQELREALETI